MILFKVPTHDTPVLFNWTVLTLLRMLMIHKHHHMKSSHNICFAF